MLELSDPQKLYSTCEAERRRGRRVGLVPTMGYLHEGHLSLVRRARELSDYVVVTIFVNPTQFGPGEDLDRYPRDPEGDLTKCLAEGVDCVFSPPGEAVYPTPGYQTHVEVEELTRPLCGARRPGHFRGVATVVAKLFNMVGPCVAVFGEKDYQQLQVIRRMAADLNMPVEVVGSPIVREPDGLALSSRNAYLSESHRRQATCLSRALATVKDRATGQGGLSSDEAVALARGVIEEQPDARIDYVEVRDARTLDEIRRVAGDGGAVMALAVFFDRTRLIDNTVL
jgi:pantoate--beta-alanine ligase